MQIVPLQPTPSQQTKVVLGGQNCQLYVYQKAHGLFVDINVDGVDVSVGTIARDCVYLVSRDYAGFAGNLMFVDSQGASDPHYSGIGGRFELVYLTADEYALV